MKLKKLKLVISSIFFLYSSHVLASTGDTAEYPCGQMLGGTGIETVSKVGVLGAGTCTIKLSDDVLNSISKIESVQKQLNELKDQNANQLSASQEGAVMYDDPNLKNTVTLNPGGAGSTITNVNNGNIASNSKDAVNGSQLWQTQNELQSNIDKLGNTIAQNKTTVSAGKNIKVVNSQNPDGSNNYQISTADDVNYNSITIGSVSIDKSKTDKNGNTIIGGVGDGLLTASSKDAVNGGQINKVSSSIADHLGGGSKFDPSSGIVTAPDYNIQGNDYHNVGDALVAIDKTTSQIIKGELGLIQTDGQITTIDKNGSSKEINVAGTNGDRIISGVAPGINRNDAVNKGQLDDKFAGLNNQIERNRKLIDQNSKSIAQNRKLASQGIASAIAMNIEYPSQHPGEFATGVGLGTYDGETSFAIGGNYLSGSGKVKFYGGAGYSVGSDAKLAAKMGIGWVW